MRRSARASRSRCPPPRVARGRTPTPSTSAAPACPPAWCRWPCATCTRPSRWSSSRTSMRARGSSPRSRRRSRPRRSSCAERSRCAARSATFGWTWRLRVMSRVIALLLLVAAAIAAVPASASADEAVAETARQTPLAAYGGWSAWSRTDAGGRYVLQLRSPGGDVRDAPLPSSSAPWDVSLGPDAGGAVTAVYRRCRARGCDVDRLDVASGRTEPLRAVSSPSFDEATPGIWRSTVVFTRRIRGCDVPYVKDLRSNQPSRRLLHTRCLQTPAGQASARGSRILVSSVDLRGADEHGAGRKASEIRRYSARGGASSVLLRQTFGEESNLFGQVAQDDRFAWTVRTGIHQANAFVRVPLGQGARQEVRAFRALGTGFAHAPDGGSLYLELWSDGAVPSRIVAAAADPFGSTGHALTPGLTAAHPAPPRPGG